MPELNERVLEDDYPVYPGYFYVADGEPVRSDIEGTARDLRRELNAKEIRNCDLVGRGMV